MKSFTQQVIERKLHRHLRGQVRLTGRRLVERECGSEPEMALPPLPAGVEETHSPARHWITAMGFAPLVSVT